MPDDLTSNPKWYTVYGVLTPISENGCVEGQLFGVGKNSTHEVYVKAEADAVIERLQEELRREREVRMTQERRAPVEPPGVLREVLEALEQVLVYADFRSEEEHQSFVESVQAARAVALRADEAIAATESAPVQHGPCPCCGTEWTPNVAPIARVAIVGGEVSQTEIYAPGLPDGAHDLFPVPLERASQPPTDAHKLVVSAGRDLLAKARSCLFVFTGEDFDVGDQTEAAELVEEINAFLDLTPSVTKDAAPYVMKPSEEAVFAKVAKSHAIDGGRLADEKSGDQKSTTGAERGERSRGLGEQQNGESLVVSAPPPVAGVTECGACDKPGEHCSNIYGICSRHGGHPPRTSAETKAAHVCGLQGFDPMRGDTCPACDAPPIKKGGPDYAARFRK